MPAPLDPGAKRALDNFMEDPEDWSSPVNRALARACVYLRSEHVPDNILYNMILKALNK